MVRPRAPDCCQSTPLTVLCTAGGLHACVFIQRALVLVWPLFSCARRLQARGRTVRTWSGAPPSPSGRAIETASWSSTWSGVASGLVKLAAASSLCVAPAHTHMHASTLAVIVVCLSHLLLKHIVCRFCVRACACVSSSLRPWTTSWTRCPRTPANSGLRRQCRVGVVRSPLHPMCSH